jgi:hypothetical protein
MTGPPGWQQPPQPQSPRGAYPGSPYPAATAPRANNELMIRLFAVVPGTLLAGIILLLISILPIAAFEDDLSTTAENWIPIPIFVLLTTVFTVLLHFIARGWVPLDLPAWSLLLAAPPILDELLTEAWEYEGLVYILLILLAGVGGLVRLIVFHVFAARRTARGNPGYSAPAR